MIPIADDAAYETVLLEALQLGMTDPEPDTPDGVRLIELADALEAYERAHLR
jgi:antitoxin component HigA of HigAB toxin-antitoxin module